MARSAEDADASDSVDTQPTPTRRKWLPKYEARFGLRPVHDASGEVTKAYCKFCESFGREDDMTLLRKKRRKTSLLRPTVSFRTDNIVKHLTTQHPSKWDEFRRLPQGERRLSFFQDHLVNEDSSIHSEMATAASMPEFEEISTSTAIDTEHVVEMEPADGRWSRNLERRGGFWGNAFWYDLQLERRVPQAKVMLEELVMALPPCDGKKVLDLCAGSGRASAAVLAAYPTAQFVLLDSSEQRLEMAVQRFEAVKAGASTTTQFIAKVVDTGDAELIEEPVDVVIACLAFHVIAEKPAHYAQSPRADASSEVSKEEVYEQLFRVVWRTLRPGGHVIFADHVGQLSLFKQLRALERAGFEDVDCAWRKEDSFVAGGRKPF